MDDPEARVAASEAAQADYRAVLTAVNGLGANQRELATNQRDMAQRLGRVETRLDTVDAKLDDTNARVRSLEDTTVEIKDLLIRALEK